MTIKVRTSLVVKFRSVKNEKLNSFKRCILVLTSLLVTLGESTTFAGSAAQIECPDVIEMSKYEGYTFLNFTREVVKPKLDERAVEGYKIASSQEIVDTLDRVSPHVKRKVLKAAGAGGVNTIKGIAEALQGKTVNLYNLPGFIAEAVSKSNGQLAKINDRYTLSTFFGLASCGGAVVEFSKGNLGYLGHNIHYGTGKEDKDMQTGRSFGAGPERQAEDASDKAYLTDLQAFVRPESNRDEKSMDAFYRGVIESLLQSKTEAYSAIADSTNAGKGKMLLTDFLAVYTAEQVRNLMDGKVDPHWDAALLEVTLLSSFHSGQKEVMLYFKDPKSGKNDESIFTSETLKQEPGGEIRDQKQAATLVDYWQFSSSTDPKQRNRSGINITKKEFRLLGRKISQYTKENNPTLYKSLIGLLKGQEDERAGKTNFFYLLSKFIIDKDAFELKGDLKGITNTFVEFLSYIRAESQNITNFIITGKVTASISKTSLATLKGTAAQAQSQSCLLSLSGQ